MRFIKHKYLIFVLLLFYFAKFQGQTHITGLIENKNGIPIENASVVIHDFSNQIIAYNYTNVKGSFSIVIELEINHDYKLLVNSLGYQEYTININSKPDNPIHNLAIILLEKPLELNEIVLKSNQKISSNGNVISLKTEYFVDDTEQTVEDVLKKLPGIEVLEDGSIKAHGKFISKLLIEGDDIFANNYQILSKNLDAKVLTAVEIIDEFQDNPVLAKVMDSDMVALNLKLKDGFKNIWFGNTTWGIGTEKRVKLSANLGLLRKKIKFFYFGDYNNLGNKASDQLSGAPASLNLSSLYQEQKIEPKIEPLFSIEKSESNLFKDGQSTFNKAFMSSLGFVTKLSPNVELRGLGAFTRDNQNQPFFAETIFNVDTNPIIITENSETNHINKIASGELELKYTGGSKSYLKNIFVYNDQPERFQNNILYNNNSTINQNLNKDNYSFYNHFNYSYVLGKDKILHNYIYLGQNQVDQNIEIRSPILNNLFSFPDDYEIDYLSDNKIKDFGISSNLFSNFGDFKHAVKIEYESLKENRSNNFTNETTLDSLQNNLHFKTDKIGFESSISYSISEKVRLSLGASVNHLKIDIGSQKKEAWLFNPELKLDLRKFKIGLFKIYYKNTFDVPESDFFLENYQLNSYRSFIRGSENIHLIKRNSFNIFYKWANKLESQALTIHFKHDKSKNNYSTTSQIGEDFILSSYGIYDGSSRISSNINFTSYFKKLNLSTNFRTNQMWSIIPFQINTQESNNLKNHFSSYHFSGTTYFDIPFNFTFKIDLNSNISRFNNIISRTHWENGTINFTYALSKVWLLSLNNDLFITENNSYHFLNSKIHYQPKESNFSYQLIANNLTNEKSFSNTIINDYTIYNSNIKLLPIYIFATVKYRF